MGQGHTCSCNLKIALFGDLGAGLKVQLEVKLGSRASGVGFGVHVWGISGGSLPLRMMFEGCSCMSVACVSMGFK